MWDSENEWQQIGGNSLTGTTYSHPGLTEGTTYYYQIRAITAEGTNYGWSTRVNEVAGMAPDPPVLTATPGYLQNEISWPAVTGAVSYELWAWDGAWTQLLDNGAAITGTSYTHTGLTARTYYYQGRAVDSEGTMSAWSAQVSAAALSSPTIAAPALTATRGNGVVTLSWTAATASSGQTIARYEYRYAASSANLPDTWTNVGNVLTVDVTSLTNGTTYNFELRAISSTGATSFAASDSATPSTVPDAPTLTATAGYQHIVLSWTAPSDNGAAITSYRIERENDDGSWTSTGGNTLPGTVLTWSPGGLTNATEYTYRIFAVNVAGDSDWTSASATYPRQPGPGAWRPVRPVRGPGSRHGYTRVGRARLQRRRSHHRLPLPV